MNKNEQNPDKKEKSTVKARQDIFLVALVEAQFNISIACDESAISRGTYYLWKAKKKFAQRLHDVFARKHDMVEEALYSNAVDGKDTIAQIFLAKTLLRKRGYFEGLPVQMEETPIEKAVELLSSLIEGESDLRTVALEFTKAGIPLPDAIRIMLSKEPVEEDLDDDTKGILSEEVLEERGRVAMEEHARQLSVFLPQRNKDVGKIKEELADRDSFSDENTEEQ